MSYVSESIRFSVPPVRVAGVRQRLAPTHRELDWKAGVGAFVGRARRRRAEVAFRDGVTMRAEYEYEESDVEAGHEEKPRKCLVCGERFTSHWVGERVCRRCKSSAAWRQG